MDLRESMFDEARRLIDEVADYSPKTGEILNAEYSKMTGLSCSFTLDQKTALTSDIATVLEKQTQIAAANVEKIIRLIELVKQAGTVRCGGS